jgi:uncharacterized protein (TIGR03084 family)
MDDGLGAIVDDLEAEQSALQSLLRGLAPGDWLRPTPAWSWDVRDSIAHLADVDEMALDTMRDGPRALAKVGAASASSADVTLRGVLRGRQRTAADVLAWWEESASTIADALRASDPSARIPWGIGMRAPSLATARLMETWAHGIDVYAAVGVTPVDTDRLRHVAWLATRALPYAYTVAGREQPNDPIRVELTLPTGAPWTMGPPDATNRIVGSAGEYCRVFVQRVRPSDAKTLVAEGDAARDALAVARAYL